MKLQDLFEAKEKSLVGMTIAGKKLPIEGKWEGDFFYYDSQLTSLEGAPSSIGGHFFCTYNNLASLKGAPASVSGHFNCSYNQLASLEGAPTSVGGYFGSDYNQLTSLKDVHTQIKKIDGEFYLTKNPITSHVLGLLLIEGLTEVVGDQTWVPILNESIKQFSDPRKRVMWAQGELIRQLGDEGKALAQL